MMTGLAKFYLYVGVFALCFGVGFLYIVFYVSTAHYSRNWFLILISIGLIVLGILSFWGLSKEGLIR